ncbi:MULTISPECIES: DUF5662 family protein [Mesorhizobium]|uniref:DUF5662 family protein n=1 Tax=Mesorhizobium TaxID=68287 RepID=UPI0007A94409|nr:MULTISPECIES: DUF5662 family protein [Mesorhizobium]AMX93741.1 hypothetical protein A4R28_11815 [Mesorhizobium ciceri]MDF3208442.1 DUF5662 family protein [Mesorhizobium sp. LMG15046]MDF3228987.1 DUF5662 family protein [Mesorhizobium sp. DSM 30133]RUU22105.1 hypothetical protein EOC84_03070 [Mesorhizobium sp. Primo-B]RUU37985.1 hypothetical protein EOC83_17145 [Mesorhizobium sp. Primo-A]
MADSTESTNRHIGHVRKAIHHFCHLMDVRAEFHDMSKFTPTEKGPLDELMTIIERDGPAPHGTDEARRRTAMLGEMITHHHANNDHHPEFHLERGISGMTLMSLVEMFCDWRAANVDRDAGEPMNLSYSIDKYKIDPMLADILRNTAADLGWAVK